MSPRQRPSREPTSRPGRSTSPPIWRPRRGICPSCNTTRMAEVDARLTDPVLPHPPVRQWVLSLPSAVDPTSTTTISSNSRNDPRGTHAALGDSRLLQMRLRPIARLCGNGPTLERRQRRRARPRSLGTKPTTLHPTPCHAELAISQLPLVWQRSSSAPDPLRRRAAPACRLLCGCARMPDVVGSRRPRVAERASVGPDARSTTGGRPGKARRLGAFKKSAPDVPSRVGIVRTGFWPAAAGSQREAVGPTRQPETSLAGREGYRGWYRHLFRWRRDLEAATGTFPG